MKKAFFFTAISIIFAFVALFCYFASITDTFQIKPENPAQEGYNNFFWLLGTFVSSIIVGFSLRILWRLK